jgi:hypothetical protein
MIFLSFFYLFAEAKLLLKAVLLMHKDDLFKIWRLFVIRVAIVITREILLHVSEKHINFMIRNAPLLFILMLFQNRSELILEDFEFLVIIGV